MHEPAAALLVELLALLLWGLVALALAAPVALFVERRSRR